MAARGWPRIKEILDGALEDWEKANGRRPAIEVSHEGALRWETKEQLAQSRPFDLQLIEPDKVGAGRAEETNLIKILRRNVGGFRRMPSRGPYLSDDEIKEIADWIDAGMPD
ncbi:MAG: cytochrome c [Deltaproteobacteria bacterium]|nr:cytochrome c [Deltaproteobacteria bacterium]